MKICGLVCVTARCQEGVLSASQSVTKQTDRAGIEHENAVALKGMGFLSAGDTEIKKFLQLKCLLGAGVSEFNTCLYSSRGPAIPPDMDINSAWNGLFNQIVALDCAVNCMPWTRVMPRPSPNGALSGPERIRTEIGIATPRSHMLCILLPALLRY